MRTGGGTESGPLYSNSRFLIGTVLILSIGVGSAGADVTLSLDPAGTFLHTHRDRARDTAAIVLADLGILPGDRLRLEAVGDFDPGPGGDTALNLVAVFSGGGVLMPAHLLDRVPGAMDAGDDLVTGCTFNGCQPTDIPEDFAVARGDGSFSHACLVVPDGATHLFAGPADSYYGDNSDPDGDFGLRITILSASSGDCCGSDPLEVTCPAEVTVECDASTEPNDTGEAAARGGCGEVTLTWSDAWAAGGCPQDAVLTRTWTATDEAGNAASCEQVVRVEDGRGPDVTVAAADLTVECDGSGNEVDLAAWLASNGGAVASDACGAVSWDDDFAGFAVDCHSTGWATVTFTAADECGNASSTTATFDIVDTTPPVIACPADMIMRPTGPSGAVVAYDATSVDTCDDGLAVVGNPPSGDSFGMGTTTTVVCTATDACGNSADCDFTVYVQTPGEAAESVIDAVYDLASLGAVNRGQANALASKLEAAVRSLGRGRGNAACSQLGAFVNQVTGLIDAGVVTSAQGQPLIDAATDVRNAAGCEAGAKGPKGRAGRVQDAVAPAALPGGVTAQCGVGTAAAGLMAMFLMTGLRMRP